MKKIITTDHAPAAIGPYSQAIIHGPLVFTAGQIGLDPKTGTMVSGGIKEQTVQALKNLQAVLAAADINLDAVLKTTIYLIKPEDFTVVNEIYAGYFTSRPPARTTVFVAGLPKGALVEIDAVAGL